jgi:hypothetical protein
MMTATMPKVVTERLSERLTSILDEIQAVMSANQIGPTEATRHVLRTHGIVNDETPDNSHKLYEFFGGYLDLYESVVIGLARRVHDRGHQLDEELRERARDTNRMQGRFARSQPMSSGGAWAIVEKYRNLSLSYETPTGYKPILRMTFADAEYCRMKAESAARGYQDRSKFFAMVKEALTGAESDLAVGELPASQQKLLDDHAGQLLTPHRATSNDE